MLVTSTLMLLQRWRAVVHLQVCPGTVITRKTKKGKRKTKRGGIRAGAGLVQQRTAKISDYPLNSLLSEGPP